MVNVYAVNRGTEEVMLEDGTVLPMIFYYVDGEETDNIEEAEIAVVETLDNKWFVVVLSEFDQPRTLN